MAWRFDKPLFSLSTDEENERAKALWEAESLGGMTEDNSRTPVPVVLLVVLTVITAFLMTFPLWGQRPTAAIYVEYVKAMNTPEIMAEKDDVKAMAKIVEMNKGKQQASKWNYDALRARHPVTLDDMRLLKPKIEALMAKGVDMEDYTVVGDQVVIANFEGNFRAEGSNFSAEGARGLRERKQPWWDQGYTIDIFYLISFFLGTTIVVKCLPHYSWQPRHHH
jgi:hypothetical protein